MAAGTLSSPFFSAATLAIPPSPSSHPSHASNHSAISQLPFAPSSPRGHFSVLHPKPLLPRRHLHWISRAELGLDSKELDALLKRNPDLEFAAASSPDSLSHRIDKLKSIGLTCFALQRLITKRPNVLSSPEISTFLDFIFEQVQDLRPAKLERLLVGTHPSLFPGVLIRMKLLLDHEFPHEKLGHLLNSIDIKRVFCERTFEEIEEMIIFLQRFGWPETVVRRPKLLNMDLHDQLIPRARFLVNLAGGDEDSARVLIRKLPAILAYTVDHLQSHLDLWRSVGLSDEKIFKIILVYPNIFSVCREKKLPSRIKFLQQCRMDNEDIFKFLTKSPLFVSLSFEENLVKKLTILVKLGYRYRTKVMALAVGAATRTSCENMQNVIGLFLSYGFSCEDVFSMSMKHPQVLQYNCESLKKKIEFLIHDMERDVGELLKFPAFLGYHLDRRIKYRYEIRKAVRGKEMSLNKLLSTSEKRFISKNKNV